MCVLFWETCDTLSPTLHLLSVTKSWWSLSKALSGLFSCAPSICELGDLVIDIVSVISFSWGSVYRGGVYYFLYVFCLFFSIIFLKNVLTLQMSHVLYISHSFYLLPIVTVLSVITKCLSNWSSSSYENWCRWKT